MIYFAAYFIQILLEGPCEKKRKKSEIKSKSRKTTKT